MDIGLKAGGIQEARIQVHWFGQAQAFGLIVGAAEQLMHDLIDRGAVAPLGIALERAFARHDDAVDLAQFAEVLEQWTVGQTDGEPPKILLQERPQNVAAQGSVSVTLVV